MRFRLISVFLLTLVFVAFNYFTNGQNDIYKIAKKISKTISEIVSQQEIKTKNLYDLLSGTHDPFIILQDQSFLENHFLNEEFLIYIFQSDSLIFWNSQQVDPSEFKTDPSFDKISIKKLSNGWFISNLKKTDDIAIVTLYPIFLRYPIQNPLLSSGFNSDRFNFAKNFTISERESEGVEIYLNEKDVIFKISYTQNLLHQTNNWFSIGLLIIFLFILSLVYSLISKIYNRFPFLNSKNWLKACLTIIDIFIIQLLIRFFAGDFLFSNNSLFNDSMLMSGWLFPSFGILIIHSHAFFHIALTVIKIEVINDFDKTVKNRYILTILCLFLFVFFSTLSVFLIEVSHYNTSSLLPIGQDSNLNRISFVVFLLTSLLHFSAIIIGIKFLFLANRFTNFHLYNYLTFIVLLALATFLMCHFSSFALLYLIYSLTIYILHTTILDKDFNQNRFKTFTILMVFVAALVITIVIHYVNERKSIQELQLTTLKLGEENDPLLEFLFPEIINHIDQDTVFKAFVRQQSLLEFDKDFEDQTIRYLRKNQLSDYFEKYSINITICRENQSLIIQPNNYTIQCNLFFDDLINLNGREIINNRLFLIDDNVEGLYYLFIIPINANDYNDDIVNVYLEFYFKYIPEGLGYPDLLVDQSMNFTQDFSNYSFASYYNGILNYKFGSYFYPTLSDQLVDNQDIMFILNGYRHIRYEINEQKTLIVSKKAKDLMDIIAPFPYFLLFLALISFLTILFLRKDWIFTQELNFSFKLKLQLFIILSLISTFLIIGIGSTIYLRNIYQSKNIDFLTEKTQSILIELEHKLKNEDLYQDGLKEYLQELLLKFSLVFFSDINLYGTNGKLLATSRPEVFERKLIAPLMNPIAFNEMHFRRKIFFVQQEQISNSTYISSYIPFKNAAGEAVAYINLPSFARESEMRIEIRSLILAYLNIFLLLASFMVAFALLLSRRLTQPLEMIQKKMQLVRIDKVNEKIVWNSRDEIGQLVNQYNNLLDQLQESAELLAKSERESAWREMAKQVAHEIKNPLTPMRLSIQYLERAWNDNDPDMDNKIKNTTQTIINQIDTLSTIASAFSDFAKMPANQPIPLKVSQLIEETIRLFNSHQDVQFDFTDHSLGQITVKIDKDNFRRALTNLIKNSIQAIGRKPNGWIHIELAENSNNFCVIQIKDNGKGMSKDEMSKIFTPNFTTKSSGMGLGLSMVKNIIETAGGTITFESIENKGSIFTLKIPVLKEVDQSK